MMPHKSTIEDLVIAKFPVSAHDLPTQDKIPAIKDIIVDDCEGLALDLGSGTGFTTYSVFGLRPTVCVDFHLPNLSYYRNKIASFSSESQPLCVVAQATELPFKPGVFRFILCSEVLEHLEDDGGAARELARVLANGGKIVITVPHAKWGFASFLELLGIKTVHDAPGPEHHFRIGYSEDSLRILFRPHGLVIESFQYYLRFFTRVATDIVGLCHLLFQKIVFRRSAWNWSEVAELEKSFVFRVYTWMFPILWAFTKLDRFCLWAPGFGLIAVLKKVSNDEKL